MNKKDKVGDLEVYDDKQEKESSNPLKKIWDATIFPEKIRSMKEEKEFQRQLREEAKELAREEIRKELIERYKKEEIEKATGKKKKSNIGEKLLKGLAGDGSTNKFAEALGGKQSGGVGSDEKMKQLLGISDSENKMATNTKLRHLLGDSQKDIINDDDIKYYISDKKVKKKKTKKKRSRKADIVHPVKDDKIDKILGKNFKKKSDDFEEKMRRMI